MWEASVWLIPKLSTLNSFFLFNQVSNNLSLEFSLRSCRPSISDLDLLSSWHLLGLWVYVNHRKHDLNRNSLEDVLLRKLMLP